MSKFILLIISWGCFAHGVDKIAYQDNWFGVFWVTLGVWSFVWSAWFSKLSWFSKPNKV